MGIHPGAAYGGVGRSTTLALAPAFTAEIKKQGSGPFAGFEQRVFKTCLQLFNYEQSCSGALKAASCETFIKRRLSLSFYINYNIIRIL